MVLEGSLNINHKNHHQVVLMPFDVDVFSGDWETTSEGICTDFNVMTSENLESNLFSIQLNSDVTHVLEIDDSWETVFLFLLSGRCKIIASDISASVKKEELLVIKEWKGGKITFDSTVNSRIIVAQIKRNSLP